MPTEPSDEFRNAVRTGGSYCAVECDFCGRVHFVSSRGHGDYEEGELEDLQSRANKEPDKYIEEGVYDCIETGEIDGKTAVLHCQCNSLGRYEDWIWEHRDLICDYLRDRGQRELNEAKRLHTKVTDAALVNRSLGRVLSSIESIFREDRKEST